jgi:hypothetical protein
MKGHTPSTIENNLPCFFRWIYLNFITHFHSLPVEAFIAFNLPFSSIVFSPLKLKNRRGKIPSSVFEATELHAADLAVDKPFQVADRGDKADSSVFDVDVGFSDVHVDRFSFGVDPTFGLDDAAAR